MKKYGASRRQNVLTHSFPTRRSSDLIKELLHQKALLEMEYEYEKEEFCKQTEAVGIIYKIKRGICWNPIRLGRSYYNSLNQLVIELSRTEHLDINHSFEFEGIRQDVKACNMAYLQGGWYVRQIDRKSVV